MQVSVDGEPDAQPTLLHLAMHLPRVAADVKHQRASLAEIHQVRRITQPLIDQRDQINRTHGVVFLTAAPVPPRLSPALYAIPRMTGE